MWLRTEHNQAMRVRGLHNILIGTGSAAPARRSHILFWFSASLAIAATYGLLALHQAFSDPYVVQDDARQHVFWMMRFMDPGLFPHDVIVDYFQSVAPTGYKALYWLLARAGLDPLFVNKLLPMVLGLIATSYCYGISRRMLHVPAAGFIATVLLNQTLWMTTALVSGTPRAFLYPLFLAFLYYLLRRSLVPCLVALALQGLFYPQIMLVSAGILLLRLFDWTHWPPRVSRTRSDYAFGAAGLGIALLVLLPYAFTTSEFGPVITAAQARAMPEFQPGGRTSFFHDTPWRFWLTGQRSGLLPFNVSLLVWAGLLLPVLLRDPFRFPLARGITGELTLLPQVAIASLCLFFAAHALLFRLHNPSRYTEHTLPIIMALASGITVTVILDVVFRWAGQQATARLQGRQPLALGFTALLGSMLVFYPVLLRACAVQFPRTSYKVGQAPALYAFLLKQPQDILTASLASEADNLPTFSRRSVLVAREYAIPFHSGYYREIRQRAMALIQAQYSLTLAEAKTLIQTYGVDFWLLDLDAFTPEYLLSNAWIRQFQPVANEALASLQRGAVPALATLMERCAVFKTEPFAVLEAACIVNAAQVG